MFAALLLDPRLALVVLSALIVGAAIPLAIAWVRILPEEAPPFDMARSDSLHTQKKMSYGFDYLPQPPVLKRSRFSIVLLAALSICFALQLPGIPSYFGVHTVPVTILLHARSWIEILPAVVFLTVPVLAVAHSFFKPNLLSIPLIAAAVLVLLLWLLSTPLYTAFAGAG
jgi:hypothetical protein